MRRSNHRIIAQCNEILTFQVYFSFLFSCFLNFNSRLSTHRCQKTWKFGMSTQFFPHIVQRSFIGQITSFSNFLRKFSPYHRRAHEKLHMKKKIVYQFRCFFTSTRKSLEWEAAKWAAKEKKVDVLYDEEEEWVSMRPAAERRRRIGKLFMRYETGGKKSRVKNQLIKCVGHLFH